MTRNRWPRAAAAILLCAICGRAFPSDTPQPWKAPPRAAHKKNPIAADGDSVSAGRTVYANNCLACHGPHGHGDGPKGRAMHRKPCDFCDPQVQAQSDGALFWKINEGKPPMPSFDEMLGDEDRWNVINYIRTLPRK
ncbi:MAG TPA: cytochrome c [Tepidisphaeraceae bacterium]|nr:cytochrome c [Tepidisphaeraceae bacterium]